MTCCGFLPYTPEHESLVWIQLGKTQWCSYNSGFLIKSQTPPKHSYCCFLHTRKPQFFSLQAWLLNSLKRKTSHHLQIVETRSWCHQNRCPLPPGSTWKFCGPIAGKCSTDPEAFSLTLMQSCRALRNSEQISSTVNRKPLQPSDSSDGLPGDWTSCSVRFPLPQSNVLCCFYLPIVNLLNITAAFTSSVHRLVRGLPAR